MSVLVKGMEMPLYATRNGEKDTIYQCAVVVHKDNTAELVVRRESAYPFANCNEAHIDKYPLIEVQTPHGRLIDADKLLKAIDNMRKHKCKTCSSIIDTKHCNRSGCWMIFISDFINSLPAIIEAEVSDNA